MKQSLRFELVGKLTTFFVIWIASSYRLTVVCILVQVKSFQDPEETIHSAEENDTSYERAGFFTEMKQKKFQNGRLRKFKMAASKKHRFPAPPILNIFSWNFYGLVLGLVELIDAKGIEMSQLLWSWGCPTNSLKTQ